jgi:hypothetical protein
MLAYVWMQYPKLPTSVRLESLWGYSFLILLVRDERMKYFTCWWLMKLLESWGLLEYLFPLVM